MLVRHSWLSVEGPAIEAAETGQQAKTGSRQQVLDQGRLKLPMAKAHNPLRPRGAAVLVEGLIAKTHVQNAPAWVEPMVVGVDQPLPRYRMTEHSAAPAAKRIAPDPRWIRRQNVERKPTAGNQTSPRRAQKALQIGGCI